MSPARLARPARPARCLAPALCRLRLCAALTLFWVPGQDIMPKPQFKPDAGAVGVHGTSLLNYMKLKPGANERLQAQASAAGVVTTRVNGTGGTVIKEYSIWGDAAPSSVPLTEVLAGIEFKEVTDYEKDQLRESARFAARRATGATGAFGSAPAEHLVVSLMGFDRGLPFDIGLTKSSPSAI
jgi:hypothetical protein